MCIAYSTKERKVVQGKAKDGTVALPWAGFARAEILHWWKRQGGALVDIEAQRFAERLW